MLIHIEKHNGILSRLESLNFQLFSWLPLAHVAVGDVADVVEVWLPLAALGAFGHYA